MRIVFMGTPDIAAVCLKRILADGFEVVGVYTQPDRPRGRGMKLTPSPVKTAALEAGIPVFQPESFREEETVRQLRELNPDLCAVVAYGRILPQKVLVDKACNVYVVLNNTTSGACVFNPKGEFTGFYGANRVEQTAEVAARYFWSAIATEEMRDKMKASVPSGFSNFDLDDEGFIFTSTESSTQDTDRVKKVNPAGYNLFADYDVIWGDGSSLWYSGTAYATRFVDIDISDDGMINCLDLTTGRVFQYDEECNLLFILGTTGDQVGGFKQVSALETLDTNIYVLDAGKNTVTIFKETVFGSIVHEATNLYNAGYYEEALGPWQEVLKRDGNYRRAYIGIASAMLKKGDYAESMKYAKLADSPYRYNEAFEGYRSEFLKEYFNVLIIGALVLIGGGYGFHKWRKKKHTQNTAGKEGDAQ